MFIIVDVCCKILFDEFIFFKKKRFVIFIIYDVVIGLKFEYMNKKRRFIVKVKVRKWNDCCCLMEWSYDEEIVLYKLELFIVSYIEVFEKLKCRLIIEEFKLYSKKLYIVGDVLFNYLYVNVVYNYGEGLVEWKVIESFIDNYLLKVVNVKMLNKV